MLTTLQRKREDLVKDIAYYNEEIKKAADRIAFIDELIEEHNTEKADEEKIVEVAHSPEYYANL